MTGTSAVFRRNSTVSQAFIDIIVCTRRRQALGNPGAFTPVFSGRQPAPFGSYLTPATGSHRRKAVQGRRFGLVAHPNLSFPLIDYLVLICSTCQCGSKFT